MNSLSLVMFLVWAIFSFSLSLFFLTHLVGVWHTFFGYASFLFFINMPCEHVAYLLWVYIFYFFFIAHIINGNFRQRESLCDLEFYFVVDGNACYLQV